MIINDIAILVEAAAAKYAAAARTTGVVTSKPQAMLLV